MTSHEKLFTSYCDIKIEPLASVIENKMYEGEFTWEDCSHVEGKFIKWCVEIKKVISITGFVRVRLSQAKSVFLFKIWKCQFLLVQMVENKFRYKEFENF